jgi:hypothetical protein
MNITSTSSVNIIIALAEKYAIPLEGAVLKISIV